MCVSPLHSDIRPASSAIVRVARTIVVPWYDIGTHYSTLRHRKHRCSHASMPCSVSPRGYSVTHQTKRGWQTYWSPPPNRQEKTQSASAWCTEAPSVRGEDRASCAPSHADHASGNPLCAAWASKPHSHAPGLAQCRVEWHRPDHSHHHQ